MSGIYSRNGLGSNVNWLETPDEAQLINKTIFSEPITLKNGDTLSVYFNMGEAIDWQLKNYPEARHDIVAEQMATLSNLKCINDSEAAWETLMANAKPLEILDDGYDCDIPTIVESKQWD